MLYAAKSQLSFRFKGVNSVEKEGDGTRIIVLSFWYLECIRIAD